MNLTNASKLAHGDFGFSTRVTAIIALCLIPSLVQTASAQNNFLVVTITDIGRPYTVIDGGCKFAVLEDDITKAFSSTPFVQAAWEGTVNHAVANLVADAKKSGGDAIVGLQISTVGSTGSTGGIAGTTINGVMACGTEVKFKN